MEKDRLNVLGAERLTHAATLAGAARPVEVPPGDPAFDQLYATYFPLLRKIAVRKFHIPRADVDALVHDVFATYLTHSDRVREVHPYMIGGICNAARQYWRKNDAEREVFCDASPCGAAADDAVLNSVVRNMLLSSVLSRLGASCRETLYRFYIRGESATSIADSRATTQNSILRLLNYCRGKAREAYRAMDEVS